jgi:pimeloyl-ACP methyl ester carboxylesterase
MASLFADSPCSMDWRYNTRVDPSVILPGPAGGDTPHCRRPTTRKYDMRNILITLFIMSGLSAAALADEVKLPYQGITLNANLEKSADSWPAGPVVLMTHGTLAHRGMEIMAGLQSMFADRGISSLAINLGLGLDDRSAGMYDCATAHSHRHTDAVAEIGAWLDWLKTQGATNVALLGHSRGGNQTARFAAASTDPVVTAVILIAPQTWSEDDAAADYEKRYGKPLAPVLAKAQALVEAGKGDTLMAPVDFIYCEQTSATATAFVSYYAPDPDMDTPGVIPGIKSPVLVVAGSEDTAIKGLPDKVEPLADGERVKLLVVDGADHFFRDLYSEDIADSVAELLGVD